MSHIHDFVGIGLGPFNLGLACLAAPIAELDGIFLDQQDGFDWHPGMLLEDATLQTPFLADLVTLADPTSRYSFLNYLKTQGRLYAFYIREDFFLLRREYNQYCQWAAAQLPSLRFGHAVQAVEYDAQRQCYQVQGQHAHSDRVFRHAARRLVLGTGTTPSVPACCGGLRAPVSHSSSYLQDKPRLQRARSITVLGSGQSAAEVYRDLLQDIDVHGYALQWITRSPRFYPLEYTKLTLEMTSPEYIDYFHALPEDTRAGLLAQQSGLYKGINSSLINEIFDLLYRKRLAGPVDTALTTNTELRGCHRQADGRLLLELHQHEQQQAYSMQTDALVLATGYAAQVPAFLQPIAERLRRDARGRLLADRNYCVDRESESVFVQNAELHTHGLASPDLGMGCYRNACILRRMLGREVYPVERRIAFQRFGAPADGRPQPARQPLAVVS
ncbi:lysine N(6)-hydroxylase/L-ornithine N(5)-oxygenase family protein [Xanthomonas hydrangeae]|uniref:Lysine N(6)-hydroxylase/L-ornithine N(5)-oxygenase family protein n=1 Tax=Xanthomonas hydrangeae TaxID=2775159 RepID=A0AAU0B5P9_9XANT|nr:lysine N(6)-hydroxylase/L-ornithine N(5)-oxygenase family protein [Xanthomonas hydrangeae]WOB48206.1 lysine N(6)-hydroxylase/L-ornithine N(5)-oxygenase family protein [Xanthomonas hydrangeae]